MRILTRAFIEAWRDAKGLSRVVNIHPSLLPAFPGKNSYAQAFDYGCTLAGASVHLVELEVDAGPICAQKSFAIHDCQSATEVESRGLALEHELYPEVLSWLCAGKYRVEKRQGGRIRVCPS